MRLTGEGRPIVERIDARFEFSDPTLVKALAQQHGMRSQNMERMLRRDGYEVEAHGPEYNTVRGPQRYLVVYPRDWTGERRLWPDTWRTHGWGAPRRV